VQPGASFTMLLVFRGIQAVGGAAMMPATLSILNVEFSAGQRGLALGYGAPWPGRPTRSARL